MDGLTFRPAMAAFMVTYMADDAVWSETESRTAFNTAIAASASEQIFANTLRVEFYNRLLVQNRDVVPIRVILDGDTSGGKVFDIQQAGGVLQIEPDDGLIFNQVSQTNLDGSTAQTADKILFRVAQAVRA